MAPKKRKAAKQPKLEEVVDEDVKVHKSHAGHLDKAEVKPKQEAAADTRQDDDEEDMFAKRRAKKTGVSSPPQKKQATAPPEQAHAQSDSGIWVNRAPVLTLWVSTVAQQQGYSKEAGDTFGKAIAGILAHSKGRSIGIYEDKEKDEEAAKKKAAEEEKKGVRKADVFNMKIKALDEDGDVRALGSDGKPVKPASVQTYLERAFKSRLADAERALKDLASSYADPDDLAKHAYDLYSEFRPQIAQGQAGWGKPGLLDLQQIKELHKKD